MQSLFLPISEKRSFLFLSNRRLTGMELTGMVALSHTCFPTPEPLASSMPLKAVFEVLIPYQIYSFDILCLFDDVSEKYRCCIVLKCLRLSRW